jgi:Na+-translocating ferredoxin:NAD+ oxidoreductase RNF subunit RnfB
MADAPFHHTLMIVEPLCIGCTHCMRVCPTEAIRVTGGKAKVDPERCVDCGQCMDACPHDAIIIEQSDFQQIFDYAIRVAIVPSLMIGQFEDDVSEQQMFDSLRHLGFTHIYYAELGVDILHALGGKISVYSDSHPVISSYCPAMVRLIQLRYPSLLPNINLVRTPAQITAIYARSLLIHEGHNSEDIGIFYITPCAAKYAQIKTPGSATSGLIQGGLNLDYIFNLIQKDLANRKEQFKKQSTQNKKPLITQQAFLWSLTKGESASMKGRTLAVDEIHNVVEFLELVEDDRLENLDFLELRACDTGCTGGVITPRNRFLATERIKHHASTLEQTLPSEALKSIEHVSKELIRDLKTERIVAKNSFQLAVDTATALQKLEKVQKLTETLPGIDCGLCGSPTCRTLAEDIARGNASIRWCVVLKIRDPEGLNNLAKIWGESLPNNRP